MITRVILPRAGFSSKLMSSNNASNGDTLPRHSIPINPASLKSKLGKQSDVTSFSGISTRTYMNTAQA